MQKFVRGNQIVCTGHFVAADGVSEPTTAEAVLSYTDANSAPALTTIPLVEGVDGLWTGSWDSNLASEGVVEWVIRCDGGLQAAQQGSFRIVANSANV